MLANMEEYRRKLNLKSDFDTTDEQKERDDFDYESRIEAHNPVHEEPVNDGGDYWNDF